VRREDRWRPTKFVVDGSVLRASPDTNDVSVSSRLFVDLLGGELSGAVTRVVSGRLLGLGCGRVPLYDLYRPLVTSVTCADWPRSSHEIQHIDLACDLSRDLPFRDRSFDTVLLTDVLEHIPVPAALLREIYRVVVPGGALVLISVPFLYWLHEEPYDYYRYTEYGLARLGRDAGFSIEEIRSFGSGIDAVADLFAKTVLPLHWQVGPILADGSRRAAARLGRTTLGRASPRPAPACRWDTWPCSAVREPGGAVRLAWRQRTGRGASGGPLRPLSGSFCEFVLIARVCHAAGLKPTASRSASRPVTTR